MLTSLQRKTKRYHTANVYTEIDSFSKIAEQVNCKLGLKCEIYFFDRYSLDRASKGLGRSSELGKPRFSCSQTPSAMLRQNHVNITLISKLQNLPFGFL